MSRFTAHCIYLIISAVPLAVFALLSLGAATWIVDNESYGTGAIVAVGSIPGVVLSLVMHGEFREKDAEAREELREQ